MHIHSSHDIVQMTVPALPQYVSVVRSMAMIMAKMSRFETEQIHEIISAVGEACINAVQHAYKPPSGGYVGRTDINIKFVQYPEKLTIIVRDMGVGFDPVFVQQYIKRSDAENPESVKAGLSIIAQLMDEVEIDSDIGRGTQVRMTKRLSDDRKAVIIPKPEES